MSHKNIQGFTLLEILIVLLIVGLLATSVMLRAGSPDHQNAKAVAERLRDVFMYAEQQAILQPAALRFQLQKNGYDFLRYDIDHDAWQLITTDNILRFYPLPPKMQLAISPDMIIFFPNGEITPFEIHIKNYKLIGESNGAIRLSKTA